MRCRVQGCLYSAPSSGIYEIFKRCRAWIAENCHGTLTHVSKSNFTSLLHYFIWLYVNYYINVYLHSLSQDNSRFIKVPCSCKFCFRCFFSSSPLLRLEEQNRAEGGLSQSLLLRLLFRCLCPKF